MRLRGVGVLAILVCGWACGARTSLEIGDPRGREDAGAIDAGTPMDAGEPDVGLPDVGPPDADPPDADPPDAGRCVCESGVCLFRDGFEDGTAAWTLHPLWSESPNAQEGMTSLRGFWQDFDVGCPVIAPATMAVDVNLASLAAASLRFFHTGQSCALDTLRVLVSTDGGSSWATAAILDPPSASWEPQVIDLGPWVGQPAVRFGFEFDNVCGDPCGVEWYVDDVSLCAP